MKKLKIFEGIGDINGSVLQSAIRQRYYVQFYYSRDDDGVLPGPRFVEPYCYGYSVVDGKIRQYLRAWMVASTDKEDNLRGKVKIRSVSKSGRRGRREWSAESGWRLYRVDSISNMYVHRRKFSYYRKGYNGSTDIAMSTIIEQIPKSEFKGEKR